MRRLIAMVLAVLLFGTATAAIAAPADALYRTDAQAAHFLTHGLHRWAGVDLEKSTTRTAYCVGAADQSGASRDRVNRDGVPVYRSFSCVLNVTGSSGKSGTLVFQLDLVKERHGLHITSDSG